MPFSNLAVSVGAFCGCVYAVVQIGRALAAARWPSVEGELTAVRVVSEVGADGTDYDYVTYRYTVGGLPYQNDRLRFGPMARPGSVWPRAVTLPSDSSAQAFLERRYRPGERVQVHYNPRNPADSVLRLSPAFVVWPMLAFGLLFLYVGLREFV